MAFCVILPRGLVEQGVGRANNTARGEMYDEAN